MAICAWKFKAFFDCNLSIAHFFMYYTISLLSWLKKDTKAYKLSSYDFHTIGVFWDHYIISYHPVSYPTSFSLGHMCEDDLIFLSPEVYLVFGAAALKELKSTKSSSPMTETAKMHPSSAILWRLYIILTGSYVRCKTKLPIILSNLYVVYIISSPFATLIMRWFLSIHCSSDSSTPSLSRYFCKFWWA